VFFNGVPASNVAWAVAEGILSEEEIGYEPAILMDGTLVLYREEKAQSTD